MPEQDYDLPLYQSPDGEFFSLTPEQASSFPDYKPLGFTYRDAIAGGRQRIVDEPSISKTAAQMLLGLEEGATVTTPRAIGGGLEAASGLLPENYGGAALRKIGREAREGAGQIGKEYEDLSEGVGGGGAAKFARGLGSSVIPSASALLAAAPLGVLGAGAGATVTGSAVASGLQSLGGTFADAFEANKKRGMSDEEAYRKSYTPAILSGLVTGLVTKGFGGTGLEPILLGKAVPKGFSAAVREVAKDVGMEAVEEATDEAWQAVIRSTTFNPEATAEENLQGIIQAGIAGGLMAGAVRGAQSAPSAVNDLFAGKRPTAPTPPPLPVQPAPVAPVAPATPAAITPAATLPAPAPVAPVVQPVAAQPIQQAPPKEQLTPPTAAQRSELEDIRGDLEAAQLAGDTERVKYLTNLLRVKEREAWTKKVTVKPRRVAITPETQAAAPAVRASMTTEVSNLSELINQGGGQVRITDGGVGVAFDKFALSIDGDEATVGYVELKDKSQAGSGIGKRAYIALGRALLEKGITLKSSGALLGPGHKLWTSLVRDGYAIREGSGYSFTGNPLNKPPQPRRVAITPEAQAAAPKRQQKNLPIGDGFSVRTELDSPDRKQYLIVGQLGRPVGRIDLVKDSSGIWRPTPGAGLEINDQLARGKGLVQKSLQALLPELKAIGSSGISEDVTSQSAARMWQRMGATIENVAPGNIGEAKAYVLRSQSPKRQQALLQAEPIPESLKMQPYEVAGPTLAVSNLPKNPPKTYEEAQRRIDSLESELSSAGVDVLKLYDPSTTTAYEQKILESAGWKPKPAELTKAYAERDAIGASQMKESQGDIKAGLRKIGLTDSQAAKVMKSYYIDPEKSGAFEQAMASQETRNRAVLPQEIQAQDVAYILASENNQMFDELRDVNRDTLRQAAQVVQFMQDYLGIEKSFRVPPPARQLPAGPAKRPEATMPAIPVGELGIERGRVSPVDPDLAAAVEDVRGGYAERTARELEAQKAQAMPATREAMSASQMTPAERSTAAGQKKMAAEAASVATVTILNKKVREKSPGDAWDDKQIQAATGNQSLLNSIRDDLLPIYNRLYKKPEQAPAPPAQSAPAVAAKESWEMTRADLIRGLFSEPSTANDFIKRLDEFDSLPAEKQKAFMRDKYPDYAYAGRMTRVTGDGQLQAVLRLAPHRAAVEAALREGKTVPPAVLAEYPELKQAAGKAAAQPEPAYISPEELLARQPKAAPSESVARIEAEEEAYRNRPKKQTGAELQKEYEAQQKAAKKAEPAPDKDIIARTAPVQRVDIDNGTRVQEFRVRKTSAKEMGAQWVNYYTKPWVVERRTVKRNLDTGEVDNGEWSPFARGETRQKAIEDGLGDTAFMQATSEDDTHKKVVAKEMFAQQWRADKKKRLEEANREVNYATNAVLSIKEDANKAYKTALKRAKLFEAAGKNEADPAKIKAIQEKLQKEWFPKRDAAEAALKKASENAKAIEAETQPPYAPQEQAPVEVLRNPPPGTPAQVAEGKPREVSEAAGEGAPEKRDKSKPEQMTPEEYVPKADPINQGLFKSKKEATERLLGMVKTIRSSKRMSDILSQYGLKPEDAYEVSKTERGKWSLGATHKHRVANALVENNPVSAAAVDTYGIKLPPGYILEGDLYVYRPEVKPEQLSLGQTPTARPAPSLSKMQVEQAVRELFDGNTPPNFQVTHNYGKTFKAKFPLGIFDGTTLTAKSSQAPTAGQPVAVVLKDGTKVGTYDPNTGGFAFTASAPAAGAELFFQQARTVRGWYDADTGTIWLNAAYLRSPQEARAVFIEEAFHAIQNDKVVQQELSRLVASLTPEQLSTARAAYGNISEQQLQMEAVADILEKQQLTQEQRGILARLWDAVIGAVERLYGRFTGKVFTERDAQDILAKALKAAAVGKRSLKGGGEVYADGGFAAKNRRNSLRLRLTREALTEMALSQASWRDWYSEHQETLDDFFGDHADVFQKILSATSQAATVKSNIGLALKAFGQWIRGEQFSGYLPAVIGNLNRIRDEEQLQGQKISAYQSANKGESVVVVDRHIARMLFGVDSPSKAQFEKAQRVLTEISNEMGWKPEQVQAALWAASIVKSGKTPESYANYLKRLETESAIQSRTGITPSTGSGGDGAGGGRGRYSGGIQTARGAGVAGGQAMFSTGSPQNQLDQKYFEAIQRGDMQEVQALVDEAARGAGYDSLEVYRGDRIGKTTFTGREDRSNFIQGNVFFSSEPAIAAGYAPNNRRWKQGYVRAKDLQQSDGLYRAKLNISNPLIVDARGEGWDSVPFNGKSIQIDDLAVKARELGHDGLIVKDVVDQYGTSDQYVVFNPSQIKSSDPITYDDSGNIIPLSQRFQQESPDIRYSLGGPVSQSDAATSQKWKQFVSEDGLLNVQEFSAALQSGVLDVGPIQSSLMLELSKNLGSEYHPVKIQVVDEPSSQTGWQGRFRTFIGKRDGIVEIASKKTNGATISDSTFILILNHELLHNGITSKLPSADRGLIRKFERLYNFAKEKSEGTEWSGKNPFKNLDEFIAEGLSRKQFREWLAGIDYTNTIEQVEGSRESYPDFKPVSIFSRLLELTRQLLGLPTNTFPVSTVSALEQLVSLSGQLLYVRRSSNDYLYAFAPPENISQSAATEIQGRAIEPSTIAAASRSVADLGRQSIEEFEQAGRELEGLAYESKAFRQARSELNNLVSLHEGRLRQLPQDRVTDDMRANIRDGVSIENGQIVVGDELVTKLAQMGVQARPELVKAMQAEVYFEQQARRLVDNLGKLATLKELRDYYTRIKAPADEIKNLDKLIAAKEKVVANLTPVTTNRGRGQQSIGERASEITRANASKVELQSKRDALALEPVQEFFGKGIAELRDLSEKAKAAADLTRALMDSTTSVSELARLGEIYDKWAGFDATVKDALVKGTLTDEQRVAVLTDLQKSFHEFDAAKFRMDDLLNSEEKGLLKDIREAEAAIADAKVTSGLADVLVADALKAAKGEMGLTGTVGDAANIANLEASTGAITTLAMNLGRTLDQNRWLYDFLVAPGSMPAFGASVAQSLGISETALREILKVVQQSPSLASAIVTLTDNAAAKLAASPPLQMQSIAQLATSGNPAAMALAANLTNQIVQQANAQGTKANAARQAAARQLAQSVLRLRTLQQGQALFNQTANSPAFQQLRGAVSLGASEAQKMVVLGPTGPVLRGFKSAAKEYQPELKIDVNTSALELSKTREKVWKYLQNAEQYVEDYEAAAAAYAANPANPSPSQLGFDVADYNGLKFAIENQIVPMFLNMGDMDDTARAAQYLTPWTVRKLMKAPMFAGQIFLQYEQLGKMVGGFAGNTFRQQIAKYKRGYLDAKKVASQFQDLPKLQSAAMQSHNIRSEDTYRKIFNEMAHYGRLFGTPLRVGFTLPISNQVVTKADMEFLKRTLAFEEKLRREVTEIDPVTGVRYMRGGKEITRKGTYVGDLGMPRHMNRGATQFIADVTSAYAGTPKGFTPTTDLSTSSQDEVVKYWNEHLGTLKQHILDSLRTDRSFKQSAEMAAAEKRIAARWLAGNMNQVNSVQDLVDLIAAEIPATNGKNPLDTAREGLNNELLQYVAHAERIQKDRAEDNAKTSGLSIALSSENEYTKPAAYLELPSEYYDYGAVSSVDRITAQARSNHSTLIDFANSIRLAITELRNRMDRLKMATTDKERALILENYKGNPQEMEDVLELLTTSLKNFEDSYRAGGPDIVPTRLGQKLLKAAVGSVLAKVEIAIRNLSQGQLQVFTNLRAMNYMSAKLAAWKALSNVPRGMINTSYMVARNIAGFADRRLGRDPQFQRTLRGAVDVVADAIFKTAQAALFKPMVGAENVRKSFERVFNLGFDTSGDSWDAIKQAWIDSGQFRNQIEQDKAMKTRTSRAIHLLDRLANTALDSVNAVVRGSVLESSDTGMNALSLGLVGNMEQRLEEVAMVFGKRLTDLGITRIDPTDKRAVLQPHEWLPSMNQQTAANSLGEIRKFLESSASSEGFQLEKNLLQYYQDKMAGRPAEIFNQRTFDAVQRSMIAENNAALPTNRASAGQSSTLWRTLLTLQGYPADAFLKMLRIATGGTRNRKAVLQAASKISLALGVAALAIIVQGSGDAGAELWKRKMQGKRADRPTPLDADFYTDPDHLMRAMGNYLLLSSYYVGDIIRGAYGWADGRSTIDPLQKAFALATASQIARDISSGVKIAMKGGTTAEVLAPLRKSITRLTFGAPEIEQLLGKERDNTDAARRGITENAKAKGFDLPSPGFSGTVGLTNIKRKAISQAVSDMEVAKRKGDTDGYNKAKAEAQKQIAELEAYYLKQRLEAGDSPEVAARTAKSSVWSDYQDNNPVTAALGGKRPTAEQYKQLVESSTGERGEVIRQGIKAWQDGAQALFGKPGNITKEDVAENRSGGTVKEPSYGRVSLTGGVSGRMRSVGTTPSRGRRAKIRRVSLTGRRRRISPLRGRRKKIRRVRLTA